MDRVPVPSLVVLVGASGSGKSRWAEQTFGGLSVVSSDALRALVGEDERDQSASPAAFGLLDQAVAERLRRGLTTVVDTTGLNPDQRIAWRDAGRRAGLPVIAVAFDVPTSVCKARNRQRARRVPDAVIERQSRSFREQRTLVEEESWDQILVVSDRGVPAATVAASVAATAEAAARQAHDPAGLRFGLMISRFGFSGGSEMLGERLAALARTAEEVGFSSCWVMDHPIQIPQVGRPWEPILEPFSTLAHLAAHTERLRLGPLVANIALRPVPELGRTIAALDVLSGGRVTCGLGAGGVERDFAAFGRRMPSQAERFFLLEDALGFLPALWGPGTKPYEGSVLTAPETTCYPRPLQDPLPILVGGQGERRTLRLVAEHAAACNLFGPPDVVGHKVGVLRSHCDRVDRDPATVQVTHLATALVGRDDAHVAALVDDLAPRRGRDRWRARVNAGTVDDQIGRFRALADAGVDEAIVAFENHDDDAALETFVDVIDAFGSA